MQRTTIRAVIVSAVAAAVVIGGPASGALAGKKNYGEQPGYSNATTNSDGCAYNGAFGALGAESNPGDPNWNAGGEPGANGPATGEANSTRCGNPQS